MTTIYGIKNCDTMKKAMKWLDEQDIEYKFHDYKKQGVDDSALKDALEIHGWENIVNKRGMTWRKLPETEKQNMSSENALNACQKNPSLIKRPLLFHNDAYFIGFDTAGYSDIFKI